MNSDDELSSIHAPVTNGNEVVIAPTNPQPSVASVSAVLATPWPRYWARSFDFLLWFCLIIFPIAWNAPRTAERFAALLAYLLALPLMMLLDAFVYSLCGNTPGKSMAGIRVLNEDLTKVGFTRYLNRTFQVYLRGMALGTLFAIFTLIHSYRKLHAHETLSWDQKTKTCVLQIRSGWWRSWLVACFSITILAGLGYFAKQMKSPETIIRFAAAAVNVDAPKMVDEVTRFDGVQALPGLTMQYNFTVLSEDADDLDEEFRDTFKAEVYKQAENTICRSDELNPLRAIGTTFRYRFSNRFGGLITLFSIRSSECTTHAAN